MVERFERITRDPAIMGGNACIRGMRVTAAMIVGQVEAGYSLGAILVEYQYLEREDILQALSYAASLAGEREVLLAGYEARIRYESISGPAEPTA